MVHFDTNHFFMSNIEHGFRPMMSCMLLHAMEHWTKGLDDVDIV